jgi:putative DNA primase/helicase
MTDLNETTHILYPPKTPVFSHNGQVDDVLPTEFALLEYRPSDGGIMDVWLDFLGREWLYVTGFNWWYYWQGNFWEKDEGKDLRYKHELQILMESINTRSRLAHAAEEDEKKAKLFKAFAMATKRTSTRVASVEKLCRSHRFVTSGQLDSTNGLNLRTGLLDLDTLTSRAAEPEDLMTYRLEYDYDAEATCPRWDKFLREVLVTKKDGEWLPDKSTITLFQEVAGYSLTNNTEYELMVWLSGMGGNGKTVAMTVINHLLGPLAARLNFHQLGKQGNYDLARIPGRRILWSTESERGKGIQEDVIKNLVSGEKMIARPIYGHPFEFEPTAKIWWAMNDRPAVQDTTRAIWRRLKLIPFDRTFRGPEIDTKLINKLLMEISGVLNWAIEGLRRVQENKGFTTSEMVEEATKEYQTLSNPITQWLAERTVPDSATWVTGLEAFQNWESWRISCGFSHFNRAQFDIELKRQEVERLHRGGQWSYKLGLLSGYSLTAEQPPPAEDDFFEQEEIPW